MDQRTFYLEQPASLKEMDAIESIFRHFQMNTVDVQRKLNDDASASALFDMLLFYESTSLLNCSRNTMGASAWISLSQLVKRSERKREIILSGRFIWRSQKRNLNRNSLTPTNSNPSKQTTHAERLLQPHPRRGDSSLLEGPQILTQLVGASLRRKVLKHIFYLFPLFSGRKSEPLKRTLKKDVI